MLYTYMIQVILLQEKFTLEMNGQLINKYNTIIKMLIKEF